VILFNNVEILDLSQLGEAPEPLVPLHVGHRLGISGVLVDREGARVDCVRPSQRLAKKSAALRKAATEPPAANLTVPTIA